MVVVAAVVAAGNSEDDRAAREAVYDDPLAFEAHEIPLLKKVSALFSVDQITRSVIV